MAKRVFKKSRSTSADRSKVRKAVRKASTTKNTTPKKVTGKKRAAKVARKEEANVTVFASPIYKENYQVCTQTIEIQYKEQIFVVLRSTLNDYHRAKLRKDKWGKIRVKLSSLKQKELLNK